MKNTDEWKEVLQYMNVMYKEGLLDNEVYTQTGDSSIGKISSGNCGVFGLSSDDLFTMVNDQYVALAPVKSPNGKEPVIQLASNSMGSNTFYHCCRRNTVGFPSDSLTISLRKRVP